MKEQILKEFDELIGDAPETPSFLENKVCFVCGQPYNKSKQVEKLKSFIIKSIAQTKEETIREAIKQIEEVKDVIRKQTGAFKYDDCYDDCIKILNKLKK